MKNARKAGRKKKNKEVVTLTANEAKNALGGSYKRIAKELNILASAGDIEVSEKIVNNRRWKAYVVGIDDLKAIKNKISPQKHFSGSENGSAWDLLANAVTASNNSKKENAHTNADENNNNVKFYKVCEENSELKNKIRLLEAENIDLQTKKDKEINDITAEKIKVESELYKLQSDVKYITDKSNTMEAAYAEEKIKADMLQKEVNKRNVALMLLSAVLLVIAVILACYFIFR